MKNKLNAAYGLLVLLLCVQTHFSLASEFRIIEVTQAQVDAAKLPGKSSAFTIAKYISPDGAYVAGTAGSASWMWTVKEGFNFPYFNSGYDIGAISNNGMQTLLLGSSVNNSLLNYGIVARHPSIIDETQSSTKSPGSTRLKPDQRWVTGKRIYILSPTSSNSVDGLTVKGAQATAISDDGKWVVGGMVLTSNTTYLTQAFRWSQNKGFELLPAPEGWKGAANMIATGVSADGTVIVGKIDDPDHDIALAKNHQPFIWKVGDAHSKLPGHVFPKESPPVTTAVGISGDGSTLYGHGVQYRPRADGKRDSLIKAFIWRETKGFTLVDEPAKGLQATQIFSASYDGNILVGNVKMYPNDYDGSVRERASSKITGVIWDKGKAFKANDYMKAAGINLDDWQLIATNAVSSDGLVFVGSAKNPDSRLPKAWVASLRKDGIPVAKKRTEPAKPVDPQVKIPEPPAPKSVPEATPKPVAVPEPKPAPEPIASSFVGCWRWSNGLLIKINEDGSAFNGIIPAPWREISKNEIEIDWPDITGKVSLSNDGKSLNSTDSLGQKSTAQKLSGDVLTFVGVWRWDNGGVVTISADGNMSAGAFRGTWSGSGRDYSITWPILDHIAFVPQNNSLAGKNQFGEFTAAKASGCQ